MKPNTVSFGKVLATALIICSTTTLASSSELDKHNLKDSLNSVQGNINNNQWSNSQKSASSESGLHKENSHSIEASKKILDSIKDSKSGYAEWGREYIDSKDTNIKNNKRASDGTMSEGAEKVLNLDASAIENKGETHAEMKAAGIRQPKIWFRRRGVSSSAASLNTKAASRAGIQQPKVWFRRRGVSSSAASPNSKAASRAGIQQPKVWFRRRGVSSSAASLNSKAASRAGIQQPKVWFRRRGA
ncbi:hypothetical protein AX774_g6292, partial [Zancudomyces culisetae]